VTENTKESMMYEAAGYLLGDDPFGYNMPNQRSGGGVVKFSKEEITPN